MRHLDEHTMAFFAMGAEFSPPEKEMIEAHLRECHGCRAQIDELDAVNKQVADTVDSSGASDDLRSEALMSVSRAIRRFPGGSPVRLRPRSLIRRAGLGAMVRRHPLASGSAGLVLAFLAFFLFRLFEGKGHDVDQPQYIRINATGTALEVFGKDARIFDMPVSAIDDNAESRERFRVNCTCIADLDGDGRMEVITGAPYVEGGKVVWNVLRIFSHDGQLLSKWTLGSPPVNFHGDSYRNFFGIGNVAAVHAQEPDRRDILVGLMNDRSPCCLRLIDSKGRVKGEYWHFGWLVGLTVTHIAGNDSEVVLLAGVNDVGYRSDAAFPVFTILDPKRLEGRAESGLTQGFGLPTSQAELYYARVGNVDTALVSPVNVTRPGFSQSVKVAPDSSFTLEELFFSPEGFPRISYTFDKHVSLADVWLSDNYRRILREEFLTEKTPAALDAFRLDLKNKVEYWDGSQWKRQVTRVNHSLP